MHLVASVSRLLAKCHPSCNLLHYMNNIENKEIAIELLRLEKEGRLCEALAHLHPDYSMTWMYLGAENKVFPQHKGIDEADFEEIYAVKGRDYDITNIASEGNVVFVEMIEEYPKTKETRGSKSFYRTPEVVVLEFENNKVRRGRHYCDPRLSHMSLSKDEILKQLQA